MPNFLWITAAVLFALFGIFTGALYWIYCFSFKRSRVDCDKYDGLDSEVMAPFREKNRESITALSEMTFEDVYIESPLDGIRLHARLKVTDGNSPIQILCHGYRSNPFRDFSGGAIEALDNGHGILLIDQRAHQQSEGRAITFGIRERYDLLGWASYLHGRFPTRDIILVGISMGGATVVAASELEMPDTVKCAVADCPYACVADELTHTAKKLGFPAAVYPLIRLSAKIFGGFDTRDGDFRKSAANTRIPIIIIHGEADGLVPCGMSAELRDACPEKISHVTFPDAEHGLSYLVDRDRYIAATYSFINKSLSENTEGVRSPKG